MQTRKNVKWLKNPIFSTDLPSFVRENAVKWLRFPKADFRSNCLSATNLSLVRFISVSSAWQPTLNYGACSLIELCLDQFAERQNL